MRARFHAACLALALAPSIASAQAPDPQVALRDRWRVSLELAAHTSIVDTQHLNGADLESRGALGGSVGVGVWRAVHPYVDLGARLGLRLPDSRRVAVPLGALCPGDQRVTMFPNESTVFGVLPHATLGARVRPGGPALPLHLHAGVAATAWVPTRATTIRWRCDGAATDATREVSGAVFGLAGVLGVSSHFGAAEEFSIGLEYWQHLGVPDGGHYSLGLTFGWELNRGAALPGEYGRRGRASSIAVGVTGAVLWLGGFITLAALSSIG